LTRSRAGAIIQAEVPVTIDVQPPLLSNGGQIAASAGSATPDPAAEQALRQAEDDADEAEQDIRHWQREYEDAEGEFERAVRRGGRAEERAEAAAGSARSALGGVDQAAPYWVPPSVPALKPLSGFAPDPPDVDEGFCDGGLGGVICDGGDFVGDVGYGLGQGGEELFTAATHPGDTAEGLWYSTTHPGATLDALANSCDGMSPGDCIGYIGAAAVGTKGVGKVATTARRGKTDGEAPDSTATEPAAVPPPARPLPPEIAARLPNGEVLFRTDADGHVVAPLRQIDQLTSPPPRSSYRGSAASSTARTSSSSGLRPRSRRSWRARGWLSRRWRIWGADAVPLPDRRCGIGSVRRAAGGRAGRGKQPL